MAGALGPLILPLLAAGLISGFLAGLLGIGGGLVLVPALCAILETAGVGGDARMHLAVGTSLGVIVFTASSSTWAHARRNAVDTGYLRAAGPALILGALAGAAIAGWLSNTLLTACFVLFATANAWALAFGRKRAVTTPRLPGRFEEWSAGFGVGSVAALLGIGGGLLTTPMLLRRGWTMRRAVGTSAAAGLLLALPAAAGYIASGWDTPDLPPFSAGYVSLLGVALMAPDRKSVV